MKKYYHKKRFWINTSIAIIGVLALQEENIKEVFTVFGDEIFLFIVSLNAFLSVTSKEFLAHSSSLEESNESKESNESENLEESKESNESENLEKSEKSEENKK